jgi:hypothetical protein
MDGPSNAISHVADSAEGEDAKHDDDSDDNQDDLDCAAAGFGRRRAWLTFHGDLLVVEKMSGMIVFSRLRANIPQPAHDWLESFSNYPKGTGCG